MNAGGIDGFDGGIGVRVSGQQSALGGGKDVGRLREEADAIEFGHALIGEKESDRVVTGFKVIEHVDSFVGRPSSEDAETVRIAASQVAFDGLKHVGIVVNREQNRFWHFRWALVRLANSRRSTTPVESANAGMR